MKRLKSMSSLLVPVLISALTISMTTCGGSGDTIEADSPKTEKSMAAPQTPKAEAPRSKGNRSPGWKQAVYENYTFSLPEDWKGDGDTGIWCPDDQDLDMGRPNVSLHIGATPVMPGSGIEDGLKF